MNLKGHPKLIFDFMNSIIFNIIIDSIIYVMKPVIQNELKMKIVIVGEPGTGKTNISTRFCRGTFSEYSNPTVGIQLSHRKFWGPFSEKQQIYNLVFWDLGTQIEESLMPTFFKNALGIIYVFDVTNEESLLNLDKWRDLALKYINTQNFTEMLIGNKIDLMNFREVSPENCQKWAILNRIELYFETSALLNLKIEDAFERLAVGIIKKFDESVKKPVKLIRDQPTHRGCI